MAVTLRQLIPGDRAKLIRFAKTSPEQGAYRNRLLSLGLVPGAIFTVIRKGPFGDPVQILIQGSLLVLRHRESSFLLLQRLSA